MHQEKTLPTSLTYNGYTMDIKLTTDIRQCKYCKIFGHTIGNCRARIAKDTDNNIRREREINEKKQAYQQEIADIQEAVEEDITALEIDFNLDDNFVEDIKK